MKEKVNKFHNLLAACLIGSIFILSVVTAKDYGMTWDELKDLYVAERNLRYVLTLDPAWLDFSIPVNFEIPGKHPELPHGLRPYRMYIFGNLLSSIGCYLFFEKLGLMNSVEAYHFPNKLLSAGMLVAVFLFVRRNFDIYTAYAAVPAIAFQPRLWADMQFNIKDFPYVCIMTFTLISIRNSFLKSSWKGTSLSAVLLGLAEATKLNAALIVVIAFIWCLFAGSSRKKLSGKPNIIFWTAVAVSPFITALTYIAVWPWLWADPIGHFELFMDHYLNLATKGPPHFQWGNIYLFLAVQPPAVLLFGSIGILLGIVETIRGIRRELNILLFLWLFLPVFRVTLPKVYDYDGVRHFIEYAVPLGILTARGFVYFCERFYGALAHRIPRKTAIASVVLSAALLPSGWAYTSYKIHPYEIAYFNFIVGGTKGAQQRWPDATDYWGSSYRDGMKWLTRNAEPGSLIAVPIGVHIVYCTRNMWLRNDLKVLNMDVNGFLPESQMLLYKFYQKPEQPLYIMYITRRAGYRGLITLLENREKPVYEITVDGAPILKIYKINSMDETMAKTVGLDKL